MGYITLSGRENTCLSKKRGKKVQKNMLEFEKNVLHFFQVYIIMHIVKRSYPSSSFYNNPLFYYLYSPRKTR